jgi:uncharacterized alpha-E superfamily protein
MLSRVADSLYWMSRYLERAEHTARLIDVNLNLMLDESSFSSDRRWQRVLVALGNPTGFEFTGDPYALTQLMTFDAANNASIIACIVSARENARQVREQISSEQWQQLNRLYHEVTLHFGDNPADALPSDFLQAVISGAQLFHGVTDSTMNHGEGWHFIQIGRYIERATATVKLLNVYIQEFWSHPERAMEGTEYLEWIGLLRSSSAFEAYCRVYTNDVAPERILEFLLLNGENPHAVRHAIDCLQQALEAVHGEGGKRRAGPLMRLSGRLQASLEFGHIAEIVEQGVRPYLYEILRQCQEIHDALFQLYINYSIESALAG